MTGAFDPVKLRALREAKGWTRARLAAATDRSVHTITSWEKGIRQPTAESLGVLVAALGVPGDQLWVGANPSLLDLRIRAGLTQQQVAGRTGISRERVRHLETGANRLQGNDIGQLAGVYAVNQAVIVSAWEVSRRLIGAEPTTDQGVKQ